MARARLEALNSTGRVTMVNTTMPANSTSPILARPRYPKIIPPKIIPHESIEPQLATGTRAMPTSSCMSGSMPTIPRGITTMKRGVR